MIEAEIAELRALSDSSRQARAPVTLDQQSVGRLCRMMRCGSNQWIWRKRKDAHRGLRFPPQPLNEMDEDEFGHCLRCGEDIHPARLDVYPVVILCVDCVG